MRPEGRVFETPALDEPKKRQSQREWDCTFVFVCVVCVCVCACVSAPSLANFQSYLRIYVF
jgi:hypothetical protein